VRVAIADDSALFRAGLVGQLRQLGFDVCAEASDGDELLGLIEERLPEAVILDIRMPPTFTQEGIETAARLRRRNSELGILVLSTYSESHYAAQLLNIGENGLGYLLKDRVDDAEALASALHRVVRGECVVDPAIVTSLLRHHRHERAIDRLSPRELEVLQLMAEGRSNAGIAQCMHLAPKTVEKHVAAVFTHLDLPAGREDNRRVIAVLQWLRATGKTRV